MKSSELMKMAEDGLIEKGRLVGDQDEDIYVFTGKTFQLYWTPKIDESMYYGLCVGDDWKLLDTYGNEVIDEL